MKKQVQKIESITVQLTGGHLLHFVGIDTATLSVVMDTLTMERSFLLKATLNGEVDPVLREPTWRDRLMNFWRNL